MSHPLTNFEIQKYQNKPKFIGVYSRNHLEQKEQQKTEMMAMTMTTQIFQWLPL